MRELFVMFFEYLREYRARKRSGARSECVDLLKIKVNKTEVGNE